MLLMVGCAKTENTTIDLETTTENTPTETGSIETSFDEGKTKKLIEDVWSNYYIDSSDLISMVQLHFGIDAVKDTTLIEFPSEDVLMAVYHNADNEYHILAISVNTDDGFGGSYDNFIQMDSFNVKEGSSYGDGTVTIEMVRIMYQIPYTRASALSNTIHCYSLTTEWLDENVVEDRVTLVIDSQNRILSCLGCEYEYDGNRLTKVSDGDCVIDYFYEIEEDSWSLYESCNGNEKKFIHSVVLEGNNIIKKSGGNQEVIYSDMIFDEYNKILSCLYDDESYSFVYNDLGQVTTYDGVWHYTERGYRNYNDRGYTVKYEYEGDIFNVILLDSESTIWSIDSFNTSGVPVQTAYRSEATGQLVYKDVDSYSLCDCWIFTCSTGAE